MTESMASNTGVTVLSLSPNPIATGEAILVDITVSNRTKWEDYELSTWASVSTLTWG